MSSVSFCLHDGLFWCQIGEWVKKKRQKEKKTVFALRLFIYYILSADLSGM